MQNTHNVIKLPLEDTNSPENLVVAADNDGSLTRIQELHKTKGKLNQYLLFK